MSDRAPQILCIAGSPRRRGNTDQLLDALADGVSQAGGVPVRLAVSQAGISPCRGCNACSSDGVCVVRDGMDDVYRMLDAADAIVTATPVYFATVPAVLKVMLDRCQPYWARRYVLHEPQALQKRPGAVLVVGGGGDPFGTACAFSPVESVYAVLGVTVDHRIEIVGPDEPGDVGRFADDLGYARSVGATLVESVRAQHSTAT
jgi:multimeric flavodoxin WrbA